MPKTLRFAVPLAALLLGSSALTAQAGWFDFGSSSKTDTTAKDSKDAQNKDKDKVQPATTLDDSIRQAQLLRLAGQYPEAIKHLSQLMMVATDDPRVVSEYGKTLAAMGRADDAINFLSRAQQLSPNDWTVYSAMGVAYDTKGDQHAAAASYDRALALKPGEPSVMINYALSRMLAKDPDSAKRLIAQVEAGGGASDPKIASNIAMIRKMAPAAPIQPQVQAVAANVPPPAAAGPNPAPTTHVAQAPLPAPQPRMAQNPPAAARPVNNGVIDFVPQVQMPNAAPAGVVMQRVPVDPLAGPVATAATHAPRPLHPKAEAAANPAPANPAPVKTAAGAAQDLQAKADALAKQLTNKPAAIAAAKAEANKPAPKVLPPTPSKVAEAKPAKAVPVKAAAKDAVPALRMSANAY